MYVSQDIALVFTDESIHLLGPSVGDSYCSCHEQSVDEVETHFEEWNRSWSCE